MNDSAHGSWLSWGCDGNKALIGRMKKMRIKVMFEEGEVDGEAGWILDDIRDAIADYSVQYGLPLPTLDVALVEPGDE